MGAGRVSEGCQEGVPRVPGGCPKGAGDVSHQPSPQTRLRCHFKAPKHSQGYLYSSSPHPKSPLAWEEEEVGEQGDVAEEDKAGEQRICGELIGGELALCPGRFSFRWLCAGFCLCPGAGREHLPEHPLLPRLDRAARGTAGGIWGFTGRGTQPDLRLPQHVVATSPRSAGN